MQLPLQPAGQQCLTIPSFPCHMLVFSTNKTTFQVTVTVLYHPADVDGLRYFDKDQGRGKQIQAGDKVLVSRRCRTAAALSGSRHWLPCSGP
jgi:hypothetical protein